MTIYYKQCATETKVDTKNKIMRLNTPQLHTHIGENPVREKLNNLSISSRLLFTAAAFTLALTTMPSAAAGIDDLQNTTPEITELWLADADTDELLVSISDGDYFDPETLPEHITVVAMANQHTESVRFGLDGVINYRVENIVPYAIAGDNNGDYAPANLSQGWHSVQATPFAADDASGSNGTEVLISFALLPDPNQIVVNTTADGHDTVPGDGHCSTQSPGDLTRKKLAPEQSTSVVPKQSTGISPRRSTGVCTLRAAIEEANALPGSQHIEVPVFDTPYQLFLGELKIRDSVVIEGGFIDSEDQFIHAVVDAQKQSRVMSVIGSPFVTLSGFKLINGEAGRAINNVDSRGGGIYIDNSWLHLIDSVVHTNRANVGGGIYAWNNYALHVQRSVISWNRAGTRDNFTHGGGLSLFDGQTWVNDSTIVDNEAGFGGGLSISGANIKVANTSIIRNAALAYGGGFEVRDESQIEIAFSTIAYNSAGVEPQDNFDRSGGGFYVNSGSVDIGNSIVTENTDPWWADREEYAPDCYSVAPSQFTSFRANFVRVLNDNCIMRDTFLGENLDFDHVGTEDHLLNIGLSFLSLYPTRPHVSLNSDSIAIDKGIGDAGISFFADCPNHDTIGNPRPRGIACDAGAIEQQPDIFPLPLLQ